jgi:hypothetical protein
VALTTSVLWLELRAGNATAASSALIVLPPLLVSVGANISVNVVLNDKYGNAAAASNATQLAFSGGDNFNAVYLHQSLLAVQILLQGPATVADCILGPCCGLHALIRIEQLCCC